MGAGRSRRSEEHTSELQSLRHLVCRLLLEKKRLQAIRLSDRLVVASPGPKTPFSPCLPSSPSCGPSPSGCATGSVKSASTAAFFFNIPATTKIYPLSLQDALLI